MLLPLADRIPIWLITPLWRERRSDMPMYGGKEMKGKKKATSNKAGSASYGPALSAAEAKKKAGKKKK